MVIQKIIDLTNANEALRTQVDGLEEQVNSNNRVINQLTSAITVVDSLNAQNETAKNMLLSIYNPSTNVWKGTWNTNLSASEKEALKVILTIPVIG